MEASSKTLASDRNRKLIERFYEEMWNRFDKSQIPTLLTQDIWFRGSLQQSKNPHAEFAEYVDYIQRTFPDFTNEVEEIVSEGGKAFARLTYRGTHRGELFAIAAPESGLSMAARRYSDFAAIRSPKYGSSAISSG